MEETDEKTIIIQLWMGSTFHPLEDFRKREKMGGGVKSSPENENAVN